MNYLLLELFLLTITSKSQFSSNNNGNRASATLPDIQTQTQPQQNNINFGSDSSNKSGQSYCGSQGFGPSSDLIEFDLTPCAQDTLLFVLIPFVIAIILVAIYTNKTFLSFADLFTEGPQNEAPLMFHDEYKEKVNSSKKHRKSKSHDRQKSISKSKKYQKAEKEIQVPKPPCSRFTIAVLYSLRVLASLFLLATCAAYLLAISFPPSSRNSLIEKTPSAIIGAVMLVLLALVTVGACILRINDATSFIVATVWIGGLTFFGIRLRSVLSYAARFGWSENTKLHANVIYMLLAAQFLVIVFLSFPLENLLSLPKTASSSPELYSTFPSRVLFLWVWPLVLRGWREPLEMNTVWNLDKGMTSGVLRRTFGKAWKVETARVDAAKAVAPQKVSGKYDYSWFLVRVLYRSFGWEYLSAGLLRLIIIIFTFFSPQLMSQLLQYLQTEQFFSSDDGKKLIANGTAAQFMGYVPRTKGYGASIVGAIILIMILNVGLTAMFAWLCDMATYKARSALMNKKSLRLRKPMDPGEVINRFASDTAAVTGAFQYIHLLWSAPIEIIVVLYLLYGILGWASFAALATSLVIAFVSVCVIPMVVRLSEQMLKINDERMNIVSGTFSFIQTIKLYGWERIFKKKISDSRNRQLDQLGKVLVITSIIGGVMSSTVNLIVLATLALYAATAPSDRPLDLARIFVGMALLNTLQQPLNTISGFYSQILKLSVSFERLGEILCAEEVTKDKNSKKKKKCSDGVAIEIKNASFKTWPLNNEQQPVKVLEGINLSIPSGKLTCVVGATGCGKSSLLGIMSSSSHLDINKNGSVEKQGHTALCSQAPWIFTGTVRENILFFKDFSLDWYQKVVAACSLTYDLDAMRGNDMAFLTDGSNLSGGQKQRIALARAVYSEADIYLFDDPFSAVDARVSLHIFDNLMGSGGLLSTKTRVLATNRVDLLKMADHVIVMKKGGILIEGTYQHVLENGGAQVRYLVATPTAQDLEVAALAAAADAESGAEKSKLFNQPDFKSFEFLKDDPNQKEYENKRLLRLTSNPALSHQVSVASSLTSTNYKVQAVKDSKNKKISKKYRVVEDEMQHRGRLPYNLYLYYIKNCSYVLAGLVLFFLVANMGLGSWNEFWLQNWGTSISPNETDSVKKNMYYLGIFTAGTIGGTLLSIGMDLTAIRFMALKASRILHRKALAATLAAPISFHSANPAGRIINRFSNDILDLDQTIPSNLLQLLNAFLSSAVSIALACIASYYVIGIAGVLIVAYGFILVFFMRSVRELRRLVLISQSPTFTYLKESMDGILTIRAFKKEKESVKKMESLIDDNSKIFYSTFAASSWLSTTISFLSLIMTIPVLLFTVYSENPVSAGFLAIALTNALSVGSSLQAIIQAYIAVEISLVSIERIKEYVDLGSEKSLRIGSEQKPIAQNRIDPDFQWPSAGKIEFRNYSTSYNPKDKEFILKHIDLKIQAGKQIAIVGRTGAGKSTIVLSLFQLLNARTGSIYIDGIDLATLNLQDVRSRLAIIPQSAMIFPGSVRENLDPAMQYTDKELWHSLELVELDSMVLNSTIDCSRLEKEKLARKWQIRNSLDSPFPGDRLSMGERQLFCLCRAILKKSKIVVLDEPTANIDVGTDMMIQAMIRKIFSKCTVITIAHRLSTIQDYDMVIVMDDGHVKEYDNPQKLLKDPNSFFSKLSNAHASTLT